jgi:hypothetical protein
VRFIIMHRTNAHWESGASPSRELVARVGELLGKMAKAGAFDSGGGLRASAEGVRVEFSDGKRTVTEGPYKARGAELPAGFTILRARSLDEAIDWASRQADALGDGEVDIRPVTEPWDIGMSPKPAHVDTRRYMVLRQATAASEGGAAPSAAQRAAMKQLIDDGTRTGTHLATESMRPSARGRRYKNSSDGISVVDGPFTESKELIGGYVIVAAASLDDVDDWARMYMSIVETEEVDVRELE